MARQKYLPFRNYLLKKKKKNQKHKENQTQMPSLKPGDTCNSMPKVMKKAKNGQKRMPTGSKFDSARKILKLLSNEKYL